MLRPHPAPASARRPESRKPRVRRQDAKKGQSSPAARDQRAPFCGAFPARGCRDLSESYGSVGIPKYHQRIFISVNLQLVRTVTLIKPEVVLYTLEDDEGKTVYCMKVGHDSHRRYQANHGGGAHSWDYLYRFRNSVVRVSHNPVETPQNLYGPKL